MSERRQLALLLAGLVALTVVGVVGASLFPQECEDLEQVGELDLVFADADAALPVDAATGAALQELGTAAGFGPWRGAVALPDDAFVSRSEFGFFVASEDAFTVLRPSLGIASVARGRVGLDVIPAGTSLALRAADGETAVFNGEYELDRCGSLPADADVLALDRGFAVVADGPEAVLLTLSGDEVWRAPGAEVVHILDGYVVFGDGTTILLRDIRESLVLAEVDGLEVTDGEPWLDAFGDLLLLPTAAGVRPVSAGRELASPPVVALPFAAPPLDAVTTPGGVVGLGVTEEGAAAVATTETASADLPDGVDPIALHASEDGHVGLVVEVDGRRALLVYGPHRATDG